MPCSDLGQSAVLYTEQIEDAARLLNGERSPEEIAVDRAGNQRQCARL
jgi:hypothetical protein